MRRLNLCLVGRFFLVLLWHARGAHAHGRLKKSDGENKKGSSFSLFWYKPHWQCGGEDTTPERAADLINAEMARGTDFVAVGSWTAPNSVGANGYGVVGSVCGYEAVDFSSPVALFYDKRKWALEDAYPAAPSCRRLPLAPWAGPWNCGSEVVPTAESCCSCTFGKGEFKDMANLNEDLGQRPWTAGKFTRKKESSRGSSEESICVVAASLPHALWSLAINNVDFEPIPSGATALSWSICTGYARPSACFNNSDSTSVIVGTSLFVSKVSSFCGDTPIVFAGDTNAANGDFPTGHMFLSRPLSELSDVRELVPYACCNDTAGGEGLMHYASDRIAVSSGRLAISNLEGGAVAPGGALPKGLGLQCHNAQEHTPLRARIAFSG
eukprot:CAMPEP_0171940960 /NCGR_PEP_ID=MMETSP0993-20121228/37491_1 /TAXON_ID=483369 /ORGANISM="non described non described, Strain CCMP2098" /LENGTH=381 /DNA_ID=CAMNT_0012583099 /DNA_START=294 /DNA_END=1439 /DNA_ORIENTATION=+